MTLAEPLADAVLQFWLEEVGEKGWFVADEAVDAACRSRFADAVIPATAGAYDAWLAAPRPTLALLILLDQFPRNLYRGEAQAFASDAKAREIAELAIARGFDAATPGSEKIFFYTPFEHSERLDHQDRSVALFEAARPGFETGLEHARKHRDVVARFGRFPHRNAALGRESTEAEIAFLAGGGYAPGARPAR